MTATEKMDFIAWAKRVTTLLVVVVLTYCVAIGQLSLSRKNSEAWAVPVDNVQQIQTQCIMPTNMMYQASKPAPRKFVPSKPVAISKALQVVYHDLSPCTKPQYLDGYKAHCWRACKSDEHVCDSPPTDDDVTHGRAEVKCFPNLFLVGIRKCRTTDIKYWFIKHPHVEVQQADFKPSRTISCPIDAIMPRLAKTGQEIADKHYLEYGPGNLMFNTVNRRNKTHLEVTTTMQMLAFLSTPHTRFLIQLRNPTDRAISYLFHWHKLGMIYTNMTLEEMTEDVIHNIITEQIDILNRCIDSYGELGCFYQSAGSDGDMSVLLKHSLYVVFIQEAYKFVPSEQILITSLEHEYHVSETDTISKMMRFFGVDFETSTSTEKMSKEVMNKGKKNPVSDKTIRALDDFYRPYNKRLAELLNDKRYLYLR